jgi:ribonuclease HI
MELMAVIEGLQAAGTKTASVTVFTDSAYVKNSVTRGFITNWQRNGWRASTGDPVANRDLWERLHEALGVHLVRWRKVKGHARVGLNPVVDALAVQAKRSKQGSLEYVYDSNPYVPMFGGYLTD